MIANADNPTRVAVVAPFGLAAESPVGPRFGTLESGAFGPLGIVSGP